MKLNIIIPTKDGGEDFYPLLKSIQNNIEFIKSQQVYIDTSIIFAINGNPKKPLHFLEKCKTDCIEFDYEICPELGKIAAIKYTLRNRKGDYLLILDDDVVFEEFCIYYALEDLKDKGVQLVSFQTKALPYKGNNIYKNFIYDIINIRSLKSLYRTKDPFLVGRFMAIKGCKFEVPIKPILEDIYLSIIYDGHYIIREEYIFYTGLDSLLKHLRRVIVFQSYRGNLNKMYPEQYKNISRKNKRIIDNEKLNNLSLYYRICYYFYCVLRLITNQIIARIFIHKRYYW